MLTPHINWLSGFGLLCIKMNNMYIYIYEKTNRKYIYNVTEEKDNKVIRNRQWQKTPETLWLSGTSFKRNTSILFLVAINLSMCHHLFSWPELIVLFFPYIIRVHLFFFFFWNKLLIFVQFFIRHVVVSCSIFSSHSVIV